MRRLLIVALLFATASAEAQIYRPRIATTTSTPPVDGSPSITITIPTSAPTYSTSTAALTIGGAAEDNLAVTEITWTCATCTPTSGSADIFVAQVEVSWGFDLTLGVGANTIIVTASDASKQTDTDQIIVTYTAGDVTAPTVTITTNGGANFAVSTGSASLAGTCVDTVGCTAITFQADTGDSGTCSGESQWTCAVIGLAVGANVLTVAGCDEAENCGTDTITITRTQSLDIVTKQLSAAIEGSNYSRTLTAEGGSTPYTWSENAGATLADDADCSGFSLSSKGVLAATPVSDGTDLRVCSFTAKVTDDAAATDTQALTITIVGSSGNIDGPNPNDYINAIELLNGVGTLTANGKTFQDPAHLEDSPDTEYVYETGDPFQDGPDATKLFIRRGKASTRDQLRPEIQNYSSGTTVLSWDTWFPKLWTAGLMASENGGNIFTHKMFQISADCENGGSRCLEIRPQYDGKDNTDGSGKVPDYSRPAGVPLTITQTGGTATATCTDGDCPFNVGQTVAIAGVDTKATLTVTAVTAGNPTLLTVANHGFPIGSVWERVKLSLTDDVPNLNSVTLTVRDANTFEASRATTAGGSGGTAVVWAYNGHKVILTTPTSTTFTFAVYGNPPSPAVKSKKSGTQAIIALGTGGTTLEESQLRGGDDIGTIDVRDYLMWPTGSCGADRLQQPDGNCNDVNFTVQAQTWTRFYAVIEHDAGDEFTKGTCTDRYELFSLYLIDEDGNFGRLYDQTPIEIGTFTPKVSTCTSLSSGIVDKFWFEYNSSSTDDPAIDVFSYFRHFVWLHTTDLTKITVGPSTILVDDNTTIKNMLVAPRP